jgi:hypothetical protein
MMQVNFAHSVGVAPGTTTMQLSGTTVRAFDPYGESIYTLRGIDTRARIRWDLIGLIGGISLIVSMGAGLLATALR